MNTAADNKTSLFGSRKNRPGVPGRITDALGGEFSKYELQAMGRLGTLVQVAAGRELIVEGRVGNEAFVVVAGTAEVTRDGELIAQIGTGAVFGEAALIDSEPRNASVVATTALSVFVMNPAEFASLLAECPRLDSSIREMTARRNAQQ